jgi:ATP-dependent RNA helicase DDX31/DBP7
MGAAPPSEAVVESALLGARLLRLHGNMEKQQRAAAFSAFRAAASGVLLCTDVAARGLNLQGVHWIVQYDLPSDPKEYVHRVGRAARLGQQGAALILLHPSEAPFLQLLQAKGMQLKELSFGSLQAALCPGGSTRDIYLLELALQRQLEERVKRTPYLHAAASAAYQSYVRAYSAHSKAVQRVLHVGQLHLGHLAKSFGLRETPTAVAKQHTKRQRQTQPKETKRKRKGLALSERLQQRQKTAMPIGGFSEFAA